MAGVGRGVSPPILTLLDAIDEHRAAFEYDWRTRFRLPLSAVGTKRMPWGEAWRLMELLARDPGSQVAAAFAGWEYPATRAELALMDLFDLTHHAAWARGGGKGSKPKPYPRPWPDRKKTRTKPEVTQAQVIEALRFAGHTKPIPTTGG